MPPVYVPVAMVKSMPELVDVGMPDVNPMIAALITAVRAVLVIAITVVQVIAVLIMAVRAVLVIPITVVQVIAVLIMAVRAVSALLIVKRSSLWSLVSTTELRSPRHTGTVVAIAKTRWS